MAKTKVYPERRDIVARIECIRDAVSMGKNILTMIQKHGLSCMETELRQIIEPPLIEAVEALALAVQAISGCEGDDDN